MSGLEVAGVVLGALPLIISALEHYANGINTAKRFWRYKSEIRSLILQVKTERDIYLNTIEQLLTGLVRIEKMQAFLSSPRGDVWRDEDVDSKLKDRLRGAYEVYLDNVEGMKTSIDNIMGKLALDPGTGKPQFSDPGLFKQEYQRLKFSVSKVEYAEHLGNLKNFNQALTRLTKQSLELEPSRNGNKTRGCPNFNFLQNYARNLFETLRSRLQCCEGHAVKLRLEHRSQMAGKGEDILEHLPYRVIFSYAAENGSHPIHSISGDWREADIRCIVDKAKPKTTPLPTPLPTPIGTTANLPGTKKRVAFAKSMKQVQAQQSNRTTTFTIVEQQITCPAPTTLKEIENLCKIMGGLHIPQQDPCVGYLIDSVKRKHGIFPLEPLPTCNQQQHWAAYSLRQILEKRAKIKRPLTKYDKLRVAVDLASSVLQLYNTPWLDEQWSDDDVYFIHRPGLSMAKIFEHPFVYRKFASTGSSQASSVQGAVSRVIRNQSLFTLGILLIELLYGKSIEELQSPRDLDCQGTPGVVWCTAVRLIDEEIEYEAGPRYLDAVRRCIRCDFDRKDSSLDSEEFQQAVYIKVVAPLEKTLEQFNSLD